MNILINIISNWQGILYGVFWLCILVTIIAFVHEYGHYIVAKLCKVKVEEFAIGMGKEAFGWTAKNGVRWKICYFPIGGYVKMLGQSDIPKADFIYKNDAEKSMSFETKSPLQKIAIAIAGPFANIILTFFVLTILYTHFGKMKINPIIGSVAKNSPALEIGMKIDDKILSINSKEISDFTEFKRIFALHGCNTMNIKIERIEGKKIKIIDTQITPRNMDIQDESGRIHTACMIGITPKSYEMIFYNAKSGIIQSLQDTIQMSLDTANGIFQLITGQRSIKELSGPLRIGKYSHKAAQGGLVSFLHFIAIISIGIGIMNLVPIPVLDGGHILMNLIAIIIRRDIPVKVQLWIYKIGFYIVIALMLTGFVNDFRFLTRFLH